MLRKTFALSLVVVLACSLFFSVNVKSVSAYSGKTQIYFGAFVGPSHLGNFGRLQAFETAVGKDVSIWNWFQLWNRPDDSENMAEFDTALMTECRAQGAIPMISWAPESGWSNFSFTNLKSILDGSQDAYLTAWGQASAAWGHPYFVRLMWEFTGSWTDGCYPFGNGNTGAAEFVQAWQYIVNKVRAAGGTDISWVWCPANVGDSVRSLASLFPGDNYVDWVATDVYATQGQTFGQTTQTEINNIHTVAPNKPMMLAEAGDLWTESDSALWWSDLLTNALPNEYPYISAVVVWQDPIDSSIGVTGSVTLPVFQHDIASSYYSSNVYSSLNISPIPTIGENPHPTPIPTPSPTASSSFGASDVAIIVVVAVIAFVAVVPKSRARLFRIMGRFVHHK